MFRQWYPLGFGWYVLFIIFDLFYDILLFSPSLHFQGHSVGKSFYIKYVTIPFNSYLIVSFSCKSRLELNVRLTEAGPNNLWLQHPPRATLSPGAFGLFDFWRSNSPYPVSKYCSIAPHVRPAGWANAPTLGHCFRPKQYAIFKVLGQLVFFILKLEKWIFYLHSKLRPWVSTTHLLSAIRSRAQLLNHLTFSFRLCLALWWPSCTIGQIPYLPRLGVKFPT